jgi:hypothetical protein
MTEAKTDDKQADKPAVDYDADQATINKQKAAAADADKERLAAESE